MTSYPDAWPLASALAPDETTRDGPPAAALSRNEAALAALYAAHAPAIHRFLTDLLRDHAAAGDATQETFVRAFQRISTLRDADRVRPWLFGIARNVSLEVRKARFRRERVIVEERRTDGGDEHSVETDVHDTRTPESEALGKEAAKMLQAALAGLSEDRRAMLLLAMDHGLPYEEIAVLMGFTLTKVKVEIHRARHQLRAELDAYGREA